MKAQTFPATIYVKIERDTADGSKILIAEKAPEDLVSGAEEVAVGKYALLSVQMLKFKLVPVVDKSKSK